MTRTRLAPDITTTPAPASRRALGAPSHNRASLQATLAGILLCVAAVLGAGPVAGEESALDPSDVVLAFDFSNSILMSETGANLRFAKALDAIANRVAETKTDLVEGDATVSFEVFGGKALPYAGCTDIALRDNPDAVDLLEECLRKIAREYRAGENAPIATKVVPRDTDHVAALNRAARFLPAGSERPAVIFFTDGRHDPRGTARDSEDVARLIQPAYEGLNPIAILPVGLGDEAAGFQRELYDIYIQNSRGMDPCPGRERFEWPNVVFPSPASAGAAVAVALQEVTCSFTVVPPPTPSPTPTPVPTPAPAAPAPPRALAAEPTNEGLHLTWQAPSNAGTSPISGYTARCRQAGTETWGSPTTEGSTVTEAQVNGLDPGYPYECEVAAVNAVGQGDWSAVSAAVAPLGLPPTPGKPSAEAGDGQVDLSVADVGPLSVLVDEYVFECADGKGGAPVAQRAPDRSATVAGLVNGVEYSCLAYTENEIGRSPASPPSDSFRPCSTLWDCQPAAPWIVALLALLLALALAWFAYRWIRGPRRWLTAVLDEGETTKLGWGPRVGARIDREGTTFAMRGDRRPSAPIRIRDLRGDRMEVTSAAGVVRVRPGQSTPVADEDGGVHHVILRRFSKPPKSPKPPQDDDWSSSTRTSSKGQPPAEEEVWS